MKKQILLAIFLVISSVGYAQQTLNANIYSDRDRTTTGSNFLRAESNISRFGVIGFGTLNVEELKELNTAGKAAFFFIPFKSARNEVVLHLAFNQNAKNGDSLLASTLLFPELGTSSVFATLEGVRRYPSTDNRACHYLAGLFEFNYKTINAARDDSSLYFSALSFTIGARYSFEYLYTLNEKQNAATFSFIPYINFMNIPNEDNSDYRYLLNDPTLPSVLKGFGVKLQAQFENLIFFANLRHTFYDNNTQQIQNRDIKGFNANIGFVVTAPLVRL